MKIALLTSEFAPFNGGIGTYARELAGAAVAAGHQVVVLAPDYHADQTAADRRRPYAVIRYAGGPAGLKGLPRRFAATWRLLSRERFDIVHAVDWPFFLPVRLLRSLQRHARTLLTVHGTEILYMREAKRKRVLDLAGFWQRGWATWIANSRYTAELLRSTFRQIEADSVRAVPLAVASDWAAGRIPRASARDAFGLAPGHFVIVSMGRVVPRKGHATLAAALALLPEAQARNVRWWVIGPLLDADHAATLRSAAAGLAATTEFLGSLPTTEVQQRLSAADLFCLPGYRDGAGQVEGFGLVFLEAAAYGLPSIATRSGGIPEAVEDGVSGLLVPERDPAALATALTELIDDPAGLAAMSHAAVAKADGASWAGVMQATYMER